MKNNIQRIIVVVAVVALLAMLLVFPASAAEFDRYYSYEDLFHTIKVDGDNVIISVAVPDDCITFQFKNNDLKKIKTYEDGPNLWIECDEFTSYEIRIFAFSAYKFDILDFPKDTVFKFDVAITDSFEVSCTGPKLRSAVYYFDVNGKQISHEGTDSDITGLRSSYSLSHQMNRPEGAHFSTFSVKLMDFVPEEDFHGRIEVTNFTLSMSVSDLYWMEVETGKTNAILSAVKTQLEENGQKLDDIISGVEENGEKLDDIVNGTPEQNEQIDNAVDEMQGAVDRLEQAGEAMNSIERPDMSDIDVSIDSLVPQTSLLAYTSPILAFWDNDTLLAMVTIVCTLVLVSWVFFGKKG